MTHSFARRETPDDICSIPGFTPALRSGCTAFKGAAVSAQTTGRISGPVMADAWVRVVPGDSVGAGQQADRLVAGAGAFPSVSACKWCNTPTGISSRWSGVFQLLRTTPVVYTNFLSARSVLRSMTSCTQQPAWHWQASMLALDCSRALFAACAVSNTRASPVCLSGVFLRSCSRPCRPLQQRQGVGHLCQELGHWH